MSQKHIPRSTIRQLREAVVENLTE
jgi:hypothetical protein